MRQTEKEKMISLKNTLKEEAHKERIDEKKRMTILKKQIEKKKMIILKKTKDKETKDKERKERIDSIIEKEHFLVKKKLCSVIRCSSWKACPFYRDPEDYERKLIKGKAICFYWSEYPNILEELEKIHFRNPRKKIVTDKGILKKDLQKQLTSIDKKLKEISERWSIST